jgi:Domain of unknown function (DUF4249)
MKYFGTFLILYCLGCREYFEPPALKNTPKYLVVDGLLTSSPDSTIITLTYTRSLKDTAPGSPELNALLTVEGDQNTSTPLTEIGDGHYGNLLTLKPDEKYRLSISTEDGRKYLSDYVPFKQTPPIDSLYWEQDTSQVYFYINTHDPQNKTTYYRWHFEETWQYSTYLTSNFDFVNGALIPRTPEQQIHNCWKFNNSPTILLGSTTRLGQDLISHYLFNTVSKSTEKIYILYSVLVEQYALTADEFDFWTELKKNSEQPGSIFDAQPSRLNGNIHCLTNPQEPVIGYLSSSTIQKKRLFVGINEMNNMNYLPYYLPCQNLKDVTTGISPSDTRRAYEYLEAPNHLFTFWYYDGAYHVAQNFCIDCREHGGSNFKPDFWP